MNNSKLIPVIVSGGAGSRLWPLSREQHSKPFICVKDDVSLLQDTFLRATQISQCDEVLTVTNRELFFKTQDEYQRLNVNVKKSYILEPFGRNTAAAIAAAAIQLVKKHGHDVLMLVLPADHLIEDLPAFDRAVQEAKAIAQQGNLVTFGIKPHAPETGFGYIEAQKNTVKRFVEKPNLETAQAFLASGNFLWNSGMFCLKASTLLDELEQYQPELIKSLTQTIENSNVLKNDKIDQLELDATCFAQVPDISIDYAVMEKSNRVAVVPCDIGWNDIGSWSAMSDLYDTDENGNAINGDVVLHDTKNSYVRSDSRMIGCVGLDNLLIIDTPDALLVANKDTCQDVKHIYSALKKQNHSAYKTHNTVNRPWGTYTVLEEGTNFKIKRIEVKPGQSLSLQMHHHRSEHWIVVSGTAKVTNGEQEFLVSKNESTYIPAGHQHRLVNPGVIDLVMIEVQSGEYLGEDDIVRFEDVYGRC